MKHKLNNLGSGKKLILTILLVAGILIAGYAFPPINKRLSWRVDAAMTAFRRVINPVGALPTAASPPENNTAGLATPVAWTTPAVTATATKTVQVQKPEPTVEIPPTSTPSPTLVPTQIADRFLLPPPEYKLGDAQDWNNCGPATLALYLRFYGWEGDQYTISDEIKPIRADRNVNVDDLTLYVTQNISWLRAEYRVGGNVELLKNLIAAGIPVLIEESFVLEEGAQGVMGASDDRWTGHYLLLTGYDNDLKTFFAQDTYRGPNQAVSYKDLDVNWKSFNRVYVMVFPPDRLETVTSLLGEDWDIENNRLNALKTAREEAAQDPSDAFAWFNVGSNLTYFEKYSDAAKAYDQAREIGLPQRMLRYQFGPFLAYFHSGRIDELYTLAEYALKVTANSEEALLWQGWALYRQGEKQKALESFQKALEARPGYGDAEYAINFVNAN